MSLRQVHWGCLTGDFLCSATTSLTLLRTGAMVATGSVGSGHTDLEGLGYQSSQRWPILQLAFAIPPFLAPRNINFRLPYLCFAAYKACLAMAGLAAWCEHAS